MTLVLWTSLFSFYLDLICLALTLFPTLYSSHLLFRCLFSKVILCFPLWSVADFHISVYLQKVLNWLHAKYNWADYYYKQFQLRLIMFVQEKKKSYFNNSHIFHQKKSCILCCLTNTSWYFNTHLCSEWAIEYKSFLLQHALFLKINF